MAFSIVVPILASAASGLGGIITYIMLFFRPGGSTQQLRGAFAAVAMFVLAVAWGAVALRQPISNPTGTKEVHWGHRLGEGIAAPLVVSAVTMGIFQSFGVRVTIPVLAAGVYASMGIGPFINGGGGMWFWFGAAAFFWVLMSITLFFGDNTETISEELRGNHQKPSFPGLVWRILTSLAVAVYIAFLAFSPDFADVMNVTTMCVPTLIAVFTHFRYILYGIMDVALLVYVFLNWMLVTPQEPIYDQSIADAGRSNTAGNTPTGITAPLNGGKSSPVGRSTSKYSA